MDVVILSRVGVKVSYPAFWERGWGSRTWSWARRGSLMWMYLEGRKTTRSGLSLLL